MTNFYLVINIKYLFYYFFTYLILLSVINTKEQSMSKIDKYLRSIKLYLTISLFFSYCSLATPKFDDYRDLINPHTKVVFTCDGGGMRGIIPLVIAAEIEKRAGVGIAQAHQRPVGNNRCSRTDGAGALQFLRSPNGCRRLVAG